MRAVVFRGAGQLSIEDLPRPEPREGEVVIKPYYAQICITDVLNFDRWPPDWPALPDGRARQRDGKTRGIYTQGIVPGHEGGGEIVEVGPGVSGYKVGDRVIVDATYSCGKCPECQALLFRDCRIYNELHNRPGWRHPTYLGINSGNPAEFGRGLMAEYCSVPVSMCYRCPDTVSDLATVAGEIGGPILASVRSSLQLGDNVVVIGGQLYGSYRLQLCRIAGADRIVYVEPNAVRRSWAERHRLADVIIDPGRDDAVGAVRAIFPTGADVVFASNTVVGSWRIASQTVRRCGTVVPMDADPRLPHHYLDGFDTTELNANGVHWKGDWPPISCAEVVKGGTSRNDHQIFVDLMAQGRIDGALPVTMVVSLWEEPDVIARAFTSSWQTEVRTAVRISGR